MVSVRRSASAVADAPHGRRVGRRALQEAAVAPDDLVGLVAGDPGERGVHPHQRVVRLARVGDGERDVGGDHRPLPQRLQVAPPGRAGRPPSPAAGRRRGRAVRRCRPARAGSRSPTAAGRSPSSASARPAASVLGPGASRTASPVTGRPCATVESGPLLLASGCAGQVGEPGRRTPGVDVDGQARRCRRARRRRCWRR